MDGEGRWIAREEALALLGIKPQTLYAYVSRGRIAARPDPDRTRRSLYAAADIAALSRADGAPRILPALPPTAAVRGEAGVASGLSLMTGGRLFYRGTDAARLSDAATLEDAARLLWAASSDPFAGLKPRVDLALGASTRSRIFAALARRAEEDRPAAGRNREDLTREAASVLNEVVDTVVGPGPRLQLHQRLARLWKVMERDSPLLRRALVLSADHPLDAAGVATRVAADAGGSPAAAAMAGLATLGGAGVARQLRDAIDFVAASRRGPAPTVSATAASGFTPPGDPIDPRAAALLEHAQLPPDLTVLVAAGREAGMGPPGFELTLALVARRLDLPRDAAFDLLLLGRLAGLLGHALDQTFDGSPIRASLRYVGPRPGAD